MKSPKVGDRVLINAGMYEAGNYYEKNLTPMNRDALGLTTADEWPYEETQESVSTWASETFGVTGNNLRVAVRANQEMSELLKKLAIDDQHPEAAEEIADVLIVLYRLAQRLGKDLHEEVDRKMETNRRREWVLDGSGCGQHVEKAR